MRQILSSGPSSRECAAPRPLEMGVNPNSYTARLSRNPQHRSSGGDALHGPSDCGGPGTKHGVKLRRSVRASKSAATDLLDFSSPNAPSQELVDVGAIHGQSLGSLLR